MPLTSTAHPIWLPASHELTSSTRAAHPQAAYEPLTVEEYGWLAEAAQASRELPEELAIR